MDERVIWASGHGVVLLAVLAGIAFASGHWAILVALAPAAYLLVFFPHDSENSPKTVVVSHLTALVAGWLTYTVLAQGIAPTSIEPMSEPGLRIVGSALLAFIASTAVFYVLSITHPMAYVTTFTAAIGGFPTIQSVAIAAGTVLIVTGLQIIRRKVGPDTDAASGAFNEEFARS
ncbi:HPP family protein [Halopenitus malekzadehii]|uniref:HPP family protein n=1 Tax=Halopenitus malekzadehii TaxID=1267564 RepID=A0A1H6K4R4_9EURY|nr:HPP family protein [Halopenitus malekzadehii]SEH68292.1 HPP family protein [Halopenitus malekzadehii]